MTEDTNLMDNKNFLETAQDGLKQIVQPFQRELNLKQKKADFLVKCMRSAARDDFLQLDELLKTKMAQEIIAAETSVDEALRGCAPIFKSLAAYADKKVEKYRIELVDDLTRLCAEADLEIQIDFPKFTVLKGIDGEIDFGARCTRINKKVLKSIDPRRILTAVSKLKARLYDRPYDPQAFIDSLGQVYLDMVEKERLTFSTSIPMQTFYLALVISMQNKPFFQNMDKGKFKGYALDQFSVDLWRYFQAGIGGTSQGYELQLTPGRNSALWLLDSQGELRQITAISFHKQQEATE